MAAELERKIRYYSNMMGGQEQLEKYYGKSISQIRDEFNPQIRDQMLAQREGATVAQPLKGLRIGLPVQVCPRQRLRFPRRSPAMEQQAGPITGGRK